MGAAAVNHEQFRDMYVSCCQSRTAPMYIAFWQLHSHLYLEKSRVIWDSVDWIIESSPTNNEYAIPAGNYVEHYL